MQKILSKYNNFVTKTKKENDMHDLGLGLDLGKKVIEVVIIEDYKLTRVGLRMALNEYDALEVIGEAEDAETGIELIKKLKPQIVLMDLGLPGMSGLEATQKVLEIAPETKIIVLTSHGQEDEVLAALGTGAKAYCLKDISPETLALVIQNVALGGCWLDPNIANYVLNTLPVPEFLDISSSANMQKVQLTERETEVLRLLVKGKSNTEIAKELIVSVHTAKAHVCSILQKLCVDDRVQAAVKAVKEHLV